MKGEILVINRLWDSTVLFSNGSFEKRPVLWQIWIPVSIPMTISSLILSATWQLDFAVCNRHVSGCRVTPNLVRSWRAAGHITSLNVGTQHVCAHMSKLQVGQVAMSLFGLCDLTFQVPGDLTNLTSTIWLCYRMESIPKPRHIFVFEGSPRI